MPYTLDKYNLGNRIIRDDKGNVVISKPIPFLRTEKLKLEKEMIEILNKLNTAQPKNHFIKRKGIQTESEIKKIVSI